VTVVVGRVIHLLASFGIAIVTLLVLTLSFFVFMEALSEPDPMLASSDPRSFGHRRVDLFQVKLQLYRLLINIWNHIWGLDKRHRKGRPHKDRRAALDKFEFDMGEIRTQAMVGRERFQFYVFLVHEIATMHLYIVVFDLFEGLFRFFLVSLKLSNKAVYQ
jgi:hypothetical protein